MGSPVDVVPGEIIEAEWGNAIRDQSISRWPDATARDVGIPIPEPGKTVWLSSPGVLEVYDGAEWVGIDILYGGPFLPLTGGTLTGALKGVRFEADIATIGDGLRVDGDPAGSFGKQVGGVGIAFSSRVFTIWGGRDGNTANNSPNITLSSLADGTANAISLNARAGEINLTADGGTNVNPLPLGRPDSEWEWRFTRGAEGFRGFANNAAGTSILEYFRLTKAGSTPRVSYRGSASTSTAVANATWFTSNEITSGSRSLGQGALAQVAHIAPGTLADIDVSADVVVSALAAVPIRRAAYAAGYLVAGDPREGVSHPMILADDLEALAPEMVDRLPVFDDDGTPLADDLVVNGSVMTAALLAYVRSLEARIAALEA